MAVEADEIGGETRKGRRNVEGNWDFTGGAEPQAV